MLKHLSITNFVIVERMELEFSSGFTVLTGETGAGKSILIDALSLVLGERGDAGQIRQDCARAEISALFDISALAGLSAWLDEHDLQGDAGECLLRRTLDSNGRSRAYINGYAATLQQLRTAGEYLVAVHSQHAHQLLLQKDAQRELLDAFAHSRELAQSVKAAYKNWQDKRRQRIACEQQMAELQNKREQLLWQIEELSTLNFSPVEWEALQNDHHRLSHLAGLLEAAETALDILSDSDAAVFGRINVVKNQLQQVAGYDPQLQTMIDLLESAQIQVQECIYEMRHYHQQLDLDPQSLQEMEQRLTAIHHLSRKYQVQPEELPDLLEKLTMQRDALDDAGNLEKLIELENSAFQTYQALAEELSVKRADAAQEMSQAVTESMQTLAMAGGAFSVSLSALDEGGADGLEQVEFQVAAHKSLQLKPLAKVASGGELSRISLAIQVIASRSGMAPTLIFDEVDVGIGGRVAEIVGQLLKRLGRARQVLCITHLPQVAATGDHHWQVMKSDADENQQVNSRIKVLDESSRTAEIARMLGGVKITEATLEHAAEMLRGSRNSAEKSRKKNNAG